MIERCPGGRHAEVGQPHTRRRCGTPSRFNLPELAVAHGQIEVRDNLVEAAGDFTESMRSKIDLATIYRRARLVCWTTALLSPRCRPRVRGRSMSCWLRAARRCTGRRTGGPRVAIRPFAVFTRPRLVILPGGGHDGAACHPGKARTKCWRHSVRANPRHERIETCRRLTRTLHPARTA